MARLFNLCRGAFSEEKIFGKYYGNCPEIKAATVTMKKYNSHKRKFYVFFPSIILDVKTLDRVLIVLVLKQARVLEIFRIIREKKAGATKEER
ncbi:MAG: hypothetical protein LBE27_04395 [Deltaproteobacteria bacterium]|jgi:hypothetical protein|nr:hypothetical protein [Deltaproteobacteria bacterium]